MKNELEWQVVEVSHGAIVLMARYVEEDGIIHVQIGEKTLRAPAGIVAPANTVRAMLHGHAIEQYGIFPVYRK